MAANDLFKQKLLEADRLPYDDLRMKQYEEALQLAIQNQDELQQFEARTEMIYTATTIGEIEKALAAFAWSAAKYDRDPDKFRNYAHVHLWNFKAILTTLSDTPRISRDQIHRVMDQMATAYAAFGGNERAVHYMRYRVFENLNDNQASEIEFATWQKHPRDSLSDCRACEAHRLTAHFAIRNNFSKALHHAQPILIGNLQCAVVPKNTYCTLMRVHALLGEPDVADKYRKLSFSKMKNETSDTYRYAEHIALHCHRGRLQAAKNLCERHLPVACRTKNPTNRFEFFWAMRRLLRDLVEKKSRMRIKLPSNFPEPSLIESQSSQEICDWLDKYLSETAAAFDKRNGNNQFEAKYHRLLGY